MTKNITVTDENGNILGTTYPKRASGLVQKGRARWINEKTICLCVRNSKEMTMTMANNFYEIFDNQITKMQEQINSDNPATALPVRIQILKTMETFMALEQKTKTLDIVQAQLEALKNDLDKTSGSSLLDEEVAVFKIREETKQHMLRLMDKLVDLTMTSGEYVSDTCEYVQ